MRFLLVDDEPLALGGLRKTLESLYPDTELVCCNTYLEALSHKEEIFQVAFLDIEMPGMSGVELAQELSKYNERLNVIFVTAYEGYVMDAFKLHASGYITKPYNDTDILQEMGDLRYPNEEIRVEVKKPLRAQCFGKFELFYKDEPMHFERRVCKEVLAYLIHLKGATASRSEICGTLWTDSVEVERRKGYFRSLMASLRSTLRENGCEDFMICTRDTFAINPKMIDCDYYRYLEGDRDPAVQFHGEYMSQYSWAEDGIYSLTNM